MGQFCWFSQLWRNLIYCPKKGHTSSPGNLADTALVRLLVTVRGPHCFQGLSWWALLLEHYYPHSEREETSTENGLMTCSTFQNMPKVDLEKNRLEFLIFRPML